MRSGQVSTLALTLRRGSVRMGRFVHSVVFGKRNLLLTNALISALMGAAGDSVQQNYDIVMSELKCDRGKVEKVEYTSTRTVHMAAAGLTTGLVSHYWYILLDRWLGIRKCPKILAAKVLLDQALFSPVNISVYFLTLGLCERSEWRRTRDELFQKGFQNIYIVEWLVWPPMQLINFSLIPLRYRILFDNIISFGFDIYSPYVKYKTSLRDENL